MSDSREATPQDSGKLVVMSGPSGTGKSTICRRLMARDSRMRLSVSATTRPPRKGERDGVDYRFISREDFEEMIRRNELAEYAEYAGRMYGTPKAPLDEAIAQGQIILLDIDVQGAAQVVQAYPEAITIFMEPPDFEELLRRLDGRNTDSPEEKQRRISIARREMEHRNEYQHRIVNDDLDKTVDTIYSLITARRRDC